MAKKLEWNDQYSVGVAEIDAQHKELFAVINELVGYVNDPIKPGQVNQIMDQLINYKKLHFATEEKYFRQFNFSGRVEHEAEHRGFEKKIEEIVGQYGNKPVEMSFVLVDFLEDWLISHLLTMDQKYIECFKNNGLK
jgi:hemerythrin